MANEGSHGKPISEFLLVELTIKEMPDLLFNIKGY